ncbi:PP2C family protein-serine/threonine phosphatase [Modestobacter roseus]|uniref:protein-serine/threonine phosphatase n=1 Tax=Modestobacter roseus TaxID=1181884 RepID=A0A562ILY3_9ACTN|nr:SpoIIE family protein phosphatase [Modestobacter roseus]MQA35231.1 SpoIIE family protein phosphatase [Modestobacter roseus]TWH71960.1 PAS domain S-box-containing protein [Modestobacter roseus]
MPDRRTPAQHSADVVRLQAVEAELSRALELSRKILDNTADGIYGLDADGRVEFVNPAAERATGYPEAVQLGSNQHELIHARRPDGTRLPVEECGVWRALRTGETVHAADEVFWHRDGHAVPVDLVAVPTVEDGRVTGVVVSFRDLTERQAAEAEAARLREIARRAAEDRALSDRLQQALLTPPPQPDHLHLVVRYLPAASGAQVGGDWYDAFLQPDGATVLVIGDVVGHDSDAAAAMGQLRGLLRALAYDNDEPLPATLSRTEHAAAGLAVSTLATAVLARVERRAGTGGRVLRWSNAGHLPPVLLAADGTSQALATTADLMLGVTADTARHEHDVDLPDGSTLLMFTDGLVERPGSDLDAGLAALQEALRDLGRTPLEELCDTLLTRLVPGSAADDVALLAVRAHPEDRPRPAEAGATRLPGPLTGAGG